jgi:hypothetical protein
MSRLLALICKLKGHDFTKWRLYSRDFDGDTYYVYCKRCRESRFLRFETGSIPLWLYKDLEV